MDNAYIDMNYEEVSSQRDVASPSFQKGLIEYRFSVSPSAGGAWIPSMSYFLIDYKFTNSAGNAALPSASKTTLACDWPSHLFSATSFKIAGYEVANVNNYCPQTHILKKRLGYVSEDFNGLAYSRDGYDADFSRRLGRTSIDGVYHKDGVRDCSNANDPQTILAQGFVTAQNGVGREIKDGTAMAGLSCNTIAKRTVGGGLDGKTWTVTSAGGANHPSWAAIASNLAVGDYVILGTATDTFLAAGLVTVVDSVTVFHMIPTVYLEGKTIADHADVGTIMSIQVPVASASEAKVAISDPRVGKTKGSVMYQPPLGIFDINDPTKLFGDFSIVLSPNQNFLKDVVESIDAKEPTTDYKFEITSMKFYIAKCKIPQMPNPDTRFTLDEFNIQGKQFNVTSSSQNFDFILPPSTNKIIVFIQDADTTATNVSASRLKVRQFGDAAWIAKYGNFANTYDEYLRGIQVTYSGITKPQSMFTAQSNDEDSNPMLHRWILTNVMNKSSSPESFEEWLSMGAYFVFDYTRDELSNGSYCSVKMDYQVPPRAIAGTGGVAQPNIILHVVSVCERDVAIAYDQGRITSVRSQIE